MQVTSKVSDASTEVPTTATPTRTSKKALGQDDFLKLLTVQMTKQDPMKPMEDTAFIAQMAQFTSLEQSKTLVTEMGYLRADMQMYAAGGMLGREVTVAAAEGNVSGVVDSITADSTSVFVNIGGVKYPYSAVIGVKPAGETTPTPTPAPAPAAG
jgi:flagellar basal-body rod modification protein FlgD